FNRSGNERTAGRRPLPGVSAAKTPLFLRACRIRFAVGAGIPADSPKSELLKMGRSNIQSKAWTTYCERVISRSRGFIDSYSRRISLAFRWLFSAWALV